MKSARISDLFLLFGIILLGAGLRFLFLLTPFMDSDQAINGLMARHILGGEFPFFFYGQDYCGSIEAYLISTVFFFLGISRFTLNMAIGFQSLFFLIFIYFLARTLFNRKTALISALFAALSSYYLIFHSVLARSAYIEIPLIGTLVFILGLKAIQHDHSKEIHFFFLGLLGGLGVWTHFLLIYYLPPLFLFFLLNDRWFWVRRPVFFLVIGLILGGLPLWTHNWVQPLATWHYLMETSGGGEPIWTSLKDFFLVRFPEILGLRNNETEKFLIPYFFSALYLIYLVSFLFLFLEETKNLLDPGKRKAEIRQGRFLFFLFLLMFPLIFSFSGFAAAHTSRYLMPVFSVLPIFFALFVRKLRTFSLVLAFLFAAAHLFANVYGTLSRSPLLSDQQTVQFRKARENDQHLLSYLKGKGLKRLYCQDYWTSVRLTFDSQEEIIFAAPTGDRYPKYSTLIDSDPGAAFIFPGDNPDFEETLKSIGGTYAKEQAFGYSVYHHFSPPPFDYIEISPFTLKAVDPRGGINGTALFDRDLHTRWSSNAPQKPGLFLSLDLGRTVPDLGRITLFSGKMEDLPRGLRLEISSDGREWRQVREIPSLWGSLFWSGPHPFHRSGNGRVDLIFPPQPGRFIRLTQLGSDPTYYWSVVECFVFQARPDNRKFSWEVKEVVSFLERKSFSPIYPGPWLQSHLSLFGKGKSINGFDETGREGVVQMLEAPIFAVQRTMARPLAAFLKKTNRWSFEEKEIGEWTVFAFDKPSPSYLMLPFRPKGFQTNVNSSKASLAGDRKISTRWTTDRAQNPGDFFQIDLGKTETVGRLRLLTGTSRNDYPRGHAIHLSIDGQHWELMNPRMTSVLLNWTGETLLEGTADLDLIFSATPLRYLKITQTGRDPEFYWSIHELELYGNAK
jgi:4-amino-4-deoxy-L-arabinose transferase-like glycosyltransferase